MFGTIRVFSLMGDFYLYVEVDSMLTTIVPNTKL